MPTGTYELAGGVVERFSCAPGPAGWRYVAAASDGVRLDLTLDGGGRQVRVEVAAGGWTLRGGVAGPSVAWFRHGVGSAPAEQSAEAAGFAGRSPGFWIAAARRVRLSPGARARLRVVEVTCPALATRVVEQGWELAGVASYATDTGPLPVGRYRVADLETGEVAEVHVAGDVVLAAPGVELGSLGSPPSL